MFVRVKKVGPYQYLQIAENRREGKRVNQSIIATLGRLDKLTASGAIDQLLRSAARFKATVWQLLGVGTTTVTGWVFTGSVSQASAIALTGAICGFVVYFIHERVWSRTHRGQVKTHNEGRVEQAELSSRGQTLDTRAEVWCGGWNAALCELTRGPTRSTGYPADIRKMSDAKPDGTVDVVHHAPAVASEHLGQRLFQHGVAHRGSLPGRTQMWMRSISSSEISSGRRL